MAITSTSAITRKTGVLPPAAAISRPSLGQISPDGLWIDKTILLVDDDKALCNFAATMLQWIGLKTVLAGNGLEALQTLQAHPEVDAVFLDVLMPVMNGEEAFHEMRKFWPRLPVILISGFDQSDLIQRFAGHPPEGFVRKPFTSEHLFSALRRVLS